MPVLDELPPETLFKSGLRLPMRGLAALEIQILFGVILITLSGG